MGIFYRYLVCCMISFVFGGCKNDNGVPNLTETYSSTDTKPFGGNVAFRLLQNSYPDNFVQVSRNAFNETGMLSYDTSALYFCLAKNFYTNENEVDHIMEFVYKGSTFFLSSSNIDSLFMNKIFCKVTNRDRMMAMISPTYQNTTTTLINEANTSKDTFAYFYKPFTSYFSDINGNYSRIVGYNAFQEANCIVFFWGKGKIFLHTDPRAFSNYFLLTNNNHRYLQQLLQLCDDSPEHLYWSDHYNRLSNKENSSSFSTLSEIMKHPPLASAFWLALVMLVILMLFGSKRRQRIIKTIPPNVNSSVAFTETIARLYLQKRDNKIIAEKMITYFNDFIRNNYFLYANSGTEEFVKVLSRKSGVPLDNTISLYKTIQQLNESVSVNDLQLLSLSNQIQEFYKTKK